MNDVQTFLLNKLEKSIAEIQSSQHFVSSDCSSEFERLGEYIKDNKEKINPITLQEKLYLLNNVIAEWQMLLNKHNHCAPQTKCIAKNVRRSLKKIKGELTAEAEARILFSLAEAEAAAGAGDVHEDGDWKKSIESGVGFSSNIYEFEDKSMFIERLFVEKERKVGFKAIGIVGVSGVGQATFCQVAFKDQEVRKYFAPRVWVHWSKQPMYKDYKKEVVKSILTCLGYEDELIGQIGGNESDGLRKLLLALRLKLKGKKYLIFLDGVWNWNDQRLDDFCSSLTKDDIDQDQLAYGLPKGDGGTVIVMSTSNKLAADMVGDMNLHRLVLGAVEDDNCWNIFLDTVGIQQTEDMRKLKVEIVKNCAGLPFVARMLGQIALQK